MTHTADLPTDEVFLDGILQELSDWEWVTRFRDSLLKHPISLMPESQFLLSELSDPKALFRGTVASLARDAALEMLGRQRHRAQHVPVCMLPTRELNACALITPKGNPVILLDFSVQLILLRLVRYYRAIETWHSASPFCHDHSETEFAISLLALARFCNTGQAKYFTNAPAAVCPSIDDPAHDNGTDGPAYMIQTFILLHEYGHVLLGHLDIETQIPFKIANDERYRLFNQSQIQEFEADEFAYNVMVEFWEPRGRSQDISFFVGLLFGLFRLVEECSYDCEPTVSVTHPPARDRWDNISRLAKVHENPTIPSAGITPTFDALVEFGTRLEFR